MSDLEGIRKRGERSVRKWIRALWKDEILENVIALLLHGLLYYGIACMLFNLSAEKQLFMDFKLLLLYVPLVLFAVCRIKCRIFSVFLLIHVFISGGIILVLPGMEERIAIGICVVWMAASSVHKRLSGDIEEACPPSAACLLFFVLYLVGLQMKRLYTVRIYICEAFLFLILFAVYRNVSGTADFFKTNEKIKNLPAGQIRYLNRMILGVFLFFFAIGMLLMTRLPVGVLFEGAAELLRLVIRGLIFLFLWLADRKEAEPGLSEQGVQQSMPFAEAGETSALAQILERVLLTAGSVLAAAGMFYLACRLLYRMYQRFYNQNRDAADESEFLWKAPVFKERTGRRRQKAKHEEEKGINQKIRRLYRKGIRRRFGTKSAISPAWTPTEWEYALWQMQEENELMKKVQVWEKLDDEIQRRILIYEKARYSQHQCEKQELEKMKDSFKIQRSK